MNPEELTEVLLTLLRDELIAKVVREGSVLHILFADGTKRTVQVV